MSEALTLKTGDTYTVMDLQVSRPRHESFEVSASGPEGRQYLRHFLSICEILFRTPRSDLRAGTCGAMTHGEDVWRIRVTDVAEESDSLLVRGLALVSERAEWLESPPSPEPSLTFPDVWRQFYDL